MKRPFLILASALAMATAAAAAAEDLPLYEIGVGAIGVYGPDYPAAGENSFNGLGFPFAVYRGEFLRLSDEGASILPIQTDRFDVSISADGAFPADSDGNDAREGLPDLDFLVQFGPELVVKGPAFAGGLGTTELALQGRAVFSTDLTDFVYQGAVFEPELRVSRRGLAGGRLRVSGSVAPVFATEGLHDYFYEVPAAFALPDRPAFDARGGYLGTELSLSAGYRLTSRINLFGGVGLQVHNGAANRDSPLFERDVTGSVALGLTVSFFQSRRTVAAD